MLSLIVRMLVPVLIRVSLSLSFSLSVSMSGYIISKSARLRTSLDSDFFVSLCLWMRVAVSDYIMTVFRCKCTPLDSSFWLLFSECFCPWSAILTLSLMMYIATSLDLRLSLSFSLSVSVSEYIIRNLHVCEQTYVTALWKTDFLFFYFACIRSSLDFCFFLPLSVWMSVPVSNYIMTYCMCIYFSSSR